VEFSVSVEKEKGYWSAVLSDWGEGIMDHSAGYGGMVGVPFFLLGIVGGLTEYGIKSYIDEKHKGSLEAKLTQLHPNELLSDRLKHYLESSNAGFAAVISETDSRDSLKSNGFDTILVINMKEWQVTLCPMPYRPSLLSGLGIKSPPRGIGPPSSDYLEDLELLEKWDKYSHKQGTAKEFLYGNDTVELKKEEEEELEKIRPLVEKYSNDYKARNWIKSTGKLISIKDGTVIWEREEVYYDEKCEWLGDMESQPELFIDSFARSISALAQNTVNEVISSN